MLDKNTKSKPKCYFNVLFYNYNINSRDWNVEFNVVSNSMFTCTAEAPRARSLIPVQGGPGPPKSFEDPLGIEKH